MVMHLVVFLVKALVDLLFVGVCLVVGGIALAALVLAFTTDM